ncbi:MAG: helix-turn-helix domain-containing protein [Proteobacteria bacterium]|nr:helix-turn-helix domain-containing protein [Pseudomonadota bacterium]MBU4009479.1 helix-turn-helix domain-containing protein [Pseudomonadota bacterium]
MNGSDKPAITCRLKEIRQSAGISQIQLASLVGIKRQAVYDIESGKYVPNTTVALQMARVLGCKVEDMFYHNLPEHSADIILADKSISPNSRISVVKIREKFVGYSLEGRKSLGQGFKAADGMLEADGKKVKLFEHFDRIEKTALLLGCDPALQILASHVARQCMDVRLKCRFASSGQSLKHLAAGQTHMAATHMHDSGKEQSNVAFAKKILGGTPANVIAFANFEEGIMIAKGNPRKIKSISDLAKGFVRFVNREAGAALRTLLDDRLESLSIPADKIAGYNNIVLSHEEGAQMLLYGLADAALGLRAIASAWGLDFITMETVRCDIIIPTDLMDHQAIRTMLDILQTRSFRDELAQLPGYENKETGRMIAAI